MRLLRLRRCLVATDLDPASDVALDSAVRLSAATGAALHVIHVVTELDPELVSDGRSPERERRVREALDRVGGPGDAKIHLVPSDPRTTIGPMAGAIGADIIVLGRQRSGAPPNAGPVGSTASAVIRDTTVPCLVVATPLRLPMERVLIAVDGSDTARGALVVALSWASALRKREGPVLTVTALSVDDPSSRGSGSQAVVDRELEELRRTGGDWAGVTVSGVTAHDTDPVGAITRYVAELDPGLVVLGTRAIGRPTDPALGSVASAVTSQITTPVLLVPPAVWEAYVHDLRVNRGPAD